MYIERQLLSQTLFFSFLSLASLIVAIYKADYSHILYITSQLCFILLRFLQSPCLDFYVLSYVTARALEVRGLSGCSRYKNSKLKREE